MSDAPTPPPPPSFPPAGQPPMGMPAGGEHPKAQTLFIASIVGLLCCAPVNIWVLLQANGILAAPGGLDVSKVKTAKTIAIVSLALWAVGLVVRLGFMRN